jgi:hypothetical protein
MGRDRWTDKIRELQGPVYVLFDEYLDGENGQACSMWEEMKIDYLGSINGINTAWET